MPVSLEILDLSGGDSYSQKHKFTGGIPAEWSSMTNLKKLDMARCGLDGECLVYVQVNTTSLRCYRMRTGPLPKVMPVSLEILNLGDAYYNNNKFTGGIPAEWSSMTNLKELRMVKCGLDGECLYVQANTTNDEKNWGARFGTFLHFSCGTFPARSCAQAPSRRRSGA